MKRPAGVCKDCWAEHVVDLDFAPSTPMPRWRPAPHPGPRCVTHHRHVTAARQLAAHGRKVESGFGIPADLYWALYEYQGGHCAIFGCRATGKTRRLAVDHDHKCCPGRTSCGKCVRGLLCGPHNEMFGRNGDDPNVFMDMADYLRFPTFLRYHWRKQGREIPTSRVLRDYAAKQVRDSFNLERGENCPPGCELRDTRHAHGARLYEPGLLQSGPQGEQLDGDTSAGSIEQ